MASASTTSGADVPGIGDTLGVGGPFGSISVDDYVAAYRDVEFSLGDAPDHSSSGDTEITLGELRPGMNIRRAQVRVKGEAFRGKLENFRGARVTPSPLVYDANGAAAPSVAGQRAFVVDFGGVRTVLGIAVPGSEAKIVLVLPWMGTDFGSRPAYPVTGSLAFYASPEPDTFGKATVGFPAIETAKLFVQIAGSGISDASQFAQETRIVTSVLPTNVRASVNGRPVFFTQPNALDREVELTGLVEELNALAGATQTTVAAKLKIATDAPGALLPSYSAATDLVIERAAAARWGGRENLDGPLAGLTPTPLDLVFPVDDAAPWKVRRIAVAIRGTFPPWRAFGPVGTPPAKLALKTSAQFSVARRFPLPGRTLLHGVALPLRMLDGEAELRLEIAADANNMPADAKPLATVELALEPAPGAAIWHDALFATPLDTEDASALWVVVKGKSGSVEWLAQSEPSPVPSATLHTYEGGRWQRYPVRGGQSPAPLMRVLREPLARENAPLLTLSIATGVTSSIALTADPSDDAPVTLEFELPGGQFLTVTPTGGVAAIATTATAAATGVLSVRSATAYFQT